MVSLIHRVHIVSEWAQIENASHGLLLLDEEGTIGLRSDSMLHTGWAERIAAGLGMVHLHPGGTECVNFWGVAEALLLDWMLTIKGPGWDRDPALGPWHNLHCAYASGSSFWLSMDHISVFWIVHYSEIRRHILLVTQHLSSRGRKSFFLLLWIWWAKRRSSHFPKICINFRVLIIRICIFWDLELSLQDLFTITGNVITLDLNIASRLSTLHQLSSTLKVIVWKRSSSLNPSSLADINSHTNIYSITLGLTGQQVTDIILGLHG